MQRVHAAAGALALALIAGFWTATILSEAFGGSAAIVAVKTAIPWFFLLLVPSLALTGATGFRLSGGRPVGLAAIKLRRMRFAAANGLLVLIPAALFLAWKARAGAFDTGFYLVQALELVAGAANIALLSLNLRDGRRLARRRRGKE